MIRIRLPEEETHRLDLAFRQEADPKYRDRIHIVRLASRDRPHEQIASNLAITTRSVQRRLDAPLERGLDGLRPRKASGAPGKIPAALADEVRRWVVDGPAKQGLGRANWTHEELAGHPYKTRGIVTSRSAVQRFRQKLGIRVCRPTHRFLRGKPEKREQAEQDIAELKERARAEEVVPSSQDEARFPMAPTLQATLGVKGHRPKVGTWECKDLLHVFVAVNLPSGAAHGNTPESPEGAKKKTGKSKARRPQEAFAQHLRHVGRVHPKGEHEEVVLLIDDAPWHAGKPVDEALAEAPRSRLKRLPAYSPQSNPIERFWKVLGRRATHDRLSDRLADLERPLRNSLCYFQTMRGRVQTLLNGRKKQSTNRAVS